MKRFFALFLAVAMTLSLCSIATFAVEKNAFQLTAADVTVDGTEDKTVSVVFSPKSAVTVMGIQGAFVENSENLEYHQYTFPVALAGTNEFVEADTSIMYADDANWTGFNVDAGGSIITLTYTVDKDTPTGSIDVAFNVENVFIGDWEELGEQTYTATINVTNTATPTPVEGYTISLEADKETANIGKTVTVAVKVDKPVNGIQATVSYNKNLFTYAGETDANGNIVVDNWFETATQTIAELKFVAKNEGVEDATGTFGFASANAYTGAYKDFLENAVPATTVSDTVTVLAKTYAVTVTSDENGNVTATPNTGVKAGEQVTLNVTPDEGYMLETLTVASKDVAADVHNNQYTFNMPAANVSVNATFKKIPANTYNVTVNSTGKGTITAEPETGITAGTEVKLTVNHEDGYKLKKLTVDGTDVTAEALDHEYIFSMPAKDVIVEAEFAAIYTITVPKVDNATVKVTVDSVVYEEGDTIRGLFEGTEFTVSAQPDATAYQVTGIVVKSNESEIQPVDGKYTLAAGNVTIEITVTEKLEIVTTANYVNGYTLITVTGPNAKGYTYGRNPMIEVGENKYAYLVEGTAAESEIAQNTGAACESIVGAKANDVNGTGVVDFNDAGAAFGCANIAYDVDTYMAMYLRADVDGNGKVEAADVNQILGK